MPPRKQPRHISRELALLALSQINASQDKLQQVDLNQLVLISIRTLTAEIHDLLETASAEVTRGNDRLLASEIRAVDVKSAKAMVGEALELAQTAINRLGSAVELPELIQLTNQFEVREYALELIGTVYRRSKEIEATITASLVDWQFSRLPQVDRDILRLAVAEILFLNIPPKVAINEAVEIAKRYSDDEGHRFINGVLRRVTDRLKTEVKQ